MVLDSVAQLVEHNTFNVGVLGSSPSWITFVNVMIAIDSLLSVAFFMFEI